MIGLPQLPDNPELMDIDAMARGTGFAVARDRERVQALLEEAIGRQSAADLETRLTAVDVPCARLITLARFVERAIEGGMLTLPVRRTAYPHGTLTDFGAGYKADGEAGVALAPAPRLGQDTRALLALAGMADAEIEQLAKEGRVRL